MANGSRKFKGEYYIGIPHSVANSMAYKSLPAWCRALYVDLRRQFRGYNNGRIAATDTILKPYNWAHSTTHKGLQLLIDHKLIERVRTGGIGPLGKTCSLYAFTDLGVDANEDSGIKGRLPNLAYMGFVPHEPTLHKKAKVHRVTEQVHGMDLTAASTVHRVTRTDNQGLPHVPSRIRPVCRTASTGAAFALHEQQRQTEEP
jgi:hypothetical protein